MGRVLSYAVVFVFLLLLAQTSYLLKATDVLVDKQSNVQGEVAYGTMTMCINTLPSLNASSCGTMINQSTILVDNSFSCQWEYSLAPGETANFSYTPVIQNGVNFSVSTDGLMTINANHTGLGIFSSMINMSDTVVGCPLSVEELYAFIILDINDPPYLKENIPGISINEGETIVALFLGDYFGDVEGDALSYNVSVHTPFTITIGDSTEVQISAENFDTETDCEEIYIYFTATDTKNLSTDSNMISLRPICSDDDAPLSGGGGSGSPCIPEWKCGKWGQCYPNGTRSRECVDLHACDLDNLKKVFWENCTYVPSCFDGIQNQDETGVDCGGSCPPCLGDPTCYDGIQNQDETGIDCGGKICDKCITPPSCKDGILNQGELGVDCGGPCKACKEIQMPSLIQEEDTSWLSFIITAILILAALALFYLLFRKDIKVALAKFGWWLTRKRRRQILLSRPEKNELLTEIKAFEEKLALKKTIEAFKTKDTMFQKLLSLNRQYLVWAFDLPIEFTIDELKLKAENVLLHESLVNLIISFTKKQQLLETKNVLVSKLHMAFMVEELKNLILGTSEYSKEDHYVASSEDAVLGNNLAKIIKLLRNSMIALQYREVEVAQRKYLTILSIYELLDEKQKLLVYGDVSRLYYHIKYLLACY